MYKDDTIYYPQDEMNTCLLPVTSGCSWNRCAFCSMYKDVKYVEVPFHDIEMELKHGYTYTEKVFLTGADPLSIGFEKMRRILKTIRQYLPYCGRVGSYASIKNISRYSVEELSILHDLGLRMLYIGFETGRDDVLEMMHKGHTVKKAIEEAKKLNEARLSFNTVIMYGIAGRRGVGEERRGHRGYGEPLPDGQDHHHEPPGLFRNGAGRNGEKERVHSSGLEGAPA